MRLSRSWICLFVLTFLLSCSKEQDERENVVLEKPLLVSSSIADLAENIVSGSQVIILTFDQNITAPKVDDIRLNGRELKEVRAAFKEIRIQVELERATKYVLHIPANTVKGPTGMGANEITITFSTRGASDQIISTQLVTKNPISPARKVYDFLRENYGNKVVSATMSNVNWNIYEAEWVYKHTGKYPAMACFDFVHHYFSPANWIDYSDTKVVENWWAERGLVGATWHWNVPKTTGSKDRAFYVSETDFDIKRALIPGTYEHGVIIEDLDKIAEYLLLLKSKNIPVIWRPLHEAAGKWFWWGAKDAQSYRELWILMFDIFQEKGLNNLIWVWTSESKDDAWYPGDAYVDVISCDIYNKNIPTDIVSVYNQLSDTYPAKIIALSEFGNVASLASQWNGGAKWSWVMPWYDYDRTMDPSAAAFGEVTHQHADISYWKGMLENDYVLSREDMPDLK